MVKGRYQVDLTCWAGNTALLVLLLRVRYCLVLLQALITRQVRQALRIAVSQGSCWQEAETLTHKYLSGNSQHKFHLCSIPVRGGYKK